MGKPRKIFWRNSGPPEIQSRMLQEVFENSLRESFLLFFICETLRGFFVAMLSKSSRGKAPRISPKIFKDASREGFLLNILLGISPGLPSRIHLVIQSFRRYLQEYFQDSSSNNFGDTSGYFFEGPFRIF